MRKRFWFLVIAFGVSFITVTGLSFYYLKQFTAITEFTGKVDQSNRIISELYKIRDAINVCDINEYSYLLTHDSSYTDTVNSNYRSIYYSLVRLGKLYTKESPQIRTLVMLRSSLLMRMDDYRRNISFSDTATGLSSYFRHGQAKRVECLEYIERMLEREYNALNGYALNRMYFQHITASTLKYILLVFCVITIILFILVIDELRKRMQSEEELVTQLIDLENSHSELQQVAFAASHNLQEPLRKIKIFSDRLLWMEKDNPETDMEDAVNRISAAADQVKGLVTELATLTGLVNNDIEKEDVELNSVVKRVIQDADPMIKSFNAVIRKGVLPAVSGYRHQVEILFKHLIDNAIKFSKEDTPPVIEIQAHPAYGSEIPGISPGLSTKKYYCITVSDNGIGFENKYINKIFLAFQRLHDDNSLREGKGIGLALCKRVMVNHSGFIIAHGEKGEGAIFKLYFPVE